MEILGCIFGEICFTTLSRLKLHMVLHFKIFLQQTAEPVEPKEAQPLQQGIQASPSPWALFPGTAKLSICLVDLMFYIITSLRFDEAHICCKFST